MIKQFLKKILPSPAEKSYGRFLQIMDSIEEQKQLTYMLMQQTEVLSRKISAAQGEVVPETAYLAKRPLGKLQFAFSLAYHCNLNCKGCAHFSPLSDAEYPDFEEAERDFARLGEMLAASMET